MHVHVAAVYPKLLASVAGIGAMVLANIPPPQLTAPTFQLDCGVLYGTTRLQECKIATGVPAPGAPANPQV